MSESKHIYIVYKTTNLVNRKFYIGVHKQDFFLPIIFDGYLGSGPVLKKAIKKYSEENFSRETLFVYYTSEEAYAKERELVNDEFIARKDTYNCCGGGMGPSFHSKETRRKMSKAQSGEKHAMFGKKHSPETRQKMSKARSGANNPFYGKTLSPEERLLISKRFSGENHPMYGKKQSEETKEKRRQSMIGKNVGKKHPPRSEEQCKAISERLTGKKQPTIQCPHCGLIGSVSNLKRWHFDNCPYLSK